MDLGPRHRRRHAAHRRGGRRRPVGHARHSAERLLRRREGLQLLRSGRRARPARRRRKASTSSARVRSRSSSSSRSGTGGSGSTASRWRARSRIRSRERARKGRRAFPSRSTSTSCRRCRRGRTERSWRRRSACSRSRTRARSWAGRGSSSCPAPPGRCAWATGSTASTEAHYASGAEASGASVRSGVTSWQSALFPSGRAFGFIVYPPRDDALPTYNEGYLFDGDGELIPARVVDAPWLRTLAPRGQDVSVVLESEKGTTRIRAESLMSCFMVMGGVGPGTEGFPVLQQAITRYTLDGETANGMMERSIPGNQLDHCMSAGASPPTVAARIDEVIANAQAKTGLDDFGGDSWREGLEVLVAGGTDRRAVQRVRRGIVLCLPRAAADQPAEDRGLVSPATRDRRAGGATSSCSVSGSRGRARRHCRICWPKIPRSAIFGSGKSSIRAHRRGCRPKPTKHAWKWRAPS